MPRALIALGSNLGDRAATLAAAVDLLRKADGLTVENVSNWHETAPVGGPAGQGTFLNGALVANTALFPEELLQRLLEIEIQLGRTRGERWGPRTLDLDLLLYDDLVLSTPALTLPHPRMLERKFVLVPACEVAPAWRHPQTHKTLAEHLQVLAD